MGNRSPTDDNNGTKYDNVHRTHIDIGEREIWPSIIRVISQVENVPPLELPPLYGGLDPDGLERLLTSANTSLSITFRYEDYLVTVNGDGDICVRAQ